MADTDWGSALGTGLKTGAKALLLSGGNPFVAGAAGVGAAGLDLKAQKDAEDDPYNMALKQSADVIRNKGRVDEGAVQSMAAKGARGAGHATGAIQKEISQGMDPNDPRQTKLLLAMNKQAAEAGTAAQTAARQQVSAEANQAYQNAVKLAAADASQESAQDAAMAQQKAKTAGEVFGGVAAEQAKARSDEAATREDSVWSQEHGTQDYGKLLEQMGPYLMMLG
jgi:hypothetical protein